MLAPTEPAEPACAEASGVGVEEADGVCEADGDALLEAELWLISEELLLCGVLDAAPGVELVEDCDCEPHLELEAELSGEVLDAALDCGLLAAASGVEVLAAPVVLLVLELLATPLVCELAEASGVLDCALMSLEELLGEAALALFGLALLGLVEELFGELVLFGDVVLGELEVLGLLWLEVAEPALPEMLPAVFWSVVDGVAAAEPLPLEAAVLETVSSLSLTFLTPETDLASFLASFLSSLEATEPLRLATPSLTEICTPCRAGLLANC